LDSVREYVNIVKDEYDALLLKLKNSGIENNKLSRELRAAHKNIGMMISNMEAQTMLNEVITGERQRQEMYVRLLLESCPDPIFIFDENMKFLLGTESTTGIFGIADMSILQGRELDNIVMRYHPPVFTDELVGMITRTIETRGEYHITKNLEVSTDSSRFEVNILPFHKDNGDFAGALIIMHDITEIIKSKEIAEQASLAKGEFLSRMSHEMRTPMNAIIGMTGIARKSDDAVKKEYCLDKIESASTHLLGVINDILDMSKIEANKFDLAYDVFNFERMIASAVNVINFRVEEKHQSLVIDIDDSIPNAIISDELRLTQVITNLLTNAVKFTPEGGTISLCAKDHPMEDGSSAIRFEVADTGIGISAEQQTRLFVSFEQADGGTARKYGGTGLGLAISKRIVELMGGSIWVESEPGIGSTFIFTIRYEKSETAHFDDQDKLRVGNGTALNFDSHHILIAEDVEINREIMSAVLEDTGLVIDFAENGQEAVSMFRDNPGKYSLVLMDIQMPEMDGFEATRNIRSLEKDGAGRIPIVAMTANVFKEDIERCIEAGMNDHLGKPIDIDDLFDMLGLYLS